MRSIKYGFIQWESIDDTHIIHVLMWTDYAGAKNERGHRSQKYFVQWEERFQMLLNIKIFCAIVRVIALYLIACKLHPRAHHFFSYPKCAKMPRAWLSICMTCIHEIQWDRVLFLLDLCSLLDCKTWTKSSI